ncbi:MAG: crossover junction endodeoxyribonuclease RuvC [Planctomycetota bacterium]|nr:crossover junction endodeoxyribonuclease RuvC [Planctomycetota bacterium]
MKEEREGGLRVLGLDMGSRATGYALLEEVDGLLKIVENGTLRAPAEDFKERLFWLYGAIQNLIKRTIPDAVAIERPIHAQNIQTALSMGMLHSAAVLASAEAGVAITEYEPSVIKKAVTGNGRASKEQVLRIVRMLFGEDTPSSDPADAVACALCFLHRRSNSTI